MSLIARLQENIISRGLGGVVTPPEEESTCETVTISLEQVVTSKEIFYPITGTYAGVSGWKWNKSIAQSIDNISSRIESSIGGYTHNLDEGSIASDWYGSALSGLKLSKISEFQDVTKRVGWRPSIEKGSYSIFHKTKAINSKACVSKILSETVSLEEEALDNSVQINLFKRDNNLNNIPYLQYVFGQINERYYFNIEDRELSVSNVFEKRIGSTQIDKESIECHSEYLGVGKTDRSICYAEYFPCINSQVLTVSGDIVNEWVKVDSFINSNETDRHYILDDLNGKIVFPKKVLDKKLFIKEDSGNYIEFFEELANLPESGRILVAGSTIPYYSKGKYKIYCASNRVASLAIGSFALEKQLGKTLQIDEHVYVNYTAVPRVDYDLLEEVFEDKSINLKPYKKINSNGILELSIEEKNVNSIILSCDKAKIVNNVFGTLFVQSDATNITAEVLNSNGKPEQEIKVTFEASEGNFEGIVPSITKVTNLNGLAKTSYQYEYSDKSLQVFSNPKTIGSSSYFEVNSLPPGINPEDITVFQSLKIDPFYGSLGASFEPESIEEVTNTNYLKVSLNKEIKDAHEYKTLYTQEYAREDISGFSTRAEINRELPLKGYYNYGLAILEYDSLIKKSAIIRYAEGNCIHIEGIEDSFLMPSKITLFKRSELKFNPSSILDRSHDRIIHSFDSELGVFSPVKATRIIGNRIYFDNIQLPEGSLTSDETMIAGYKLFFPQLVSMKAFATNPATGFIVSSNEIKIKVDFPPYLKGGNGFRFITDNEDEGSALGGANFITINPEIPNVLNIIVE